MEYHGIGQAIHRIVRRLAERGAVGISGNAGSLVANRLLGAVVLVGVDGGYIKSTVAEGAIGDGAVTDVGLVGEIDFKDCDVANDRSGDGGDEKENGGEQKKDDADPGELSVYGLARYDMLTLHQ